MTTTDDAPRVILQPGRWITLGYLAGSLVFFAGGVWMAQSEGAIGYAIAAVAAIGVVVFAVSLHPGSSYLRIDEAGVTYCSLFRERTVPWDLIDEFFVVSIKRTGMTVHKMVGFNMPPSLDRARLGRKFASAVAGCEGALPDTYGMKAEELAELLNRCLAQFKASRGEAQDEAESAEALPPWTT